MAAPFRQLILCAHKSPMNERLWIVTFNCGHEVWMTQRAKPTGRKTCALCRAHSIIEKLAREKEASDAKQD